MEDLAVHAHNIRNNFFDSTKRLVDVIPDVLLKTEPNLDLEINPRKNGSLSENTKPQARATPAAKPEEEKPAATKKK
jgi:hypothetical protein